jgi:hypothetical protein
VKNFYRRPIISAQRNSLNEHQQSKTNPHKTKRIKKAFFPIIKKPAPAEKPEQAKILKKF